MFTLTLFQRLNCRHVFSLFGMEGAVVEVGQVATNPGHSFPRTFVPTRFLTGPDIRAQIK